MNSPCTCGQCARCEALRIDEAFHTAMNDTLTALGFRPAVIACLITLDFAHTGEKPKDPGWHIFRARKDAPTMIIYLRPEDDLIDLRSAIFEAGSRCFHDEVAWHWQHLQKALGRFPTRKREVQLVIEGNEPVLPQ